MNSEKLFDMIGNIDEDLVIDAMNDNSTAVKRKGVIYKKWFVPILASAACLAILLNIFVPSYSKTLSAYDVDGLFGVYDSATTHYTKVTLPNEDIANIIGKIPNTQYLKAYKIRKIYEPSSKYELEEFQKPISQKIIDALGMNVEDFEKKEYESYNSIEIGFRNIGNNEKWENVNLSFSQYGLYKNNKDISKNVFHLLNSGDPIYLYDKKIEIDSSISREEMISSLEWLKEKLFYIFGCSFDSVDIKISYEDYKEYKVSSIDVYYYNDLGLPQKGDYILISFFDRDRSEKSSNENDLNMITANSISYFKNRVPFQNYFNTETNSKMLSLEEAEENLKKGYVFGNAPCLICMNSQEEVDFENYDHVGFEYVTSMVDEPFRSAPFYTFYKKIRTAKNGNIIYAKTYVCAIEISEIEKYFKEQHELHESI